MKRLLASAAVVIATAGTGLATTATAASATPDPEAVSVMTHVSGTPDVPSTAAVWSVHGRYSTMSECRDIAVRGDISGRWSDWECVDNLPIHVQLWVVYS